VRAFLMTWVAVVPWVSGCGGADSSTPVQFESHFAVAAPAADAGAAPAEQADAPIKTPLKIVHTAELRLVVKDIPTLEGELTALVDAAGGYAATASVQGEEERYRTGRWVFRVPVERFGSFVSDLKKLGEVRQFSTTADDVTEAYVDLEARLRNKRQEEERLLKLLAEATGKLEEILMVEKELSRVREEIERMDGQFRSLSNKIELTTITVTAGERPEEIPVEKLTFGGRLRRAFDYNVELVSAFGQRCAITAVASVPWWPLVLLIGLPTWLAYARIAKSAWWADAIGTSPRTPKKSDSV
jgi:hypothetical protein